MKKRQLFDKYEFYFRAVQDPGETLDFIEKLYRKLFGKAPRKLGEDFCGTFAISCFWAARGPERMAIAVDKDKRPIMYGMQNYLDKLTPDERRRVRVIEADVRSRRLPKVDVIASMNFSFFIFKQRQELLDYFRNCYRRLNRNGMLVLDCFGGTETWEPNQEQTKHKGFTYYWDQVSFDPITHEALFHIHFKRNGERKRERVFTYDWRMWTLPELRDILREAGFTDTEVYWEGTRSNGEGNGIFTRKEHEENCAAWIAYLVAKK